MITTIVVDDVSGSGRVACVALYGTTRLHIGDKIRLSPDPFMTFYTNPLKTDVVTVTIDPRQWRYDEARGEILPVASPAPTSAPVATLTGARPGSVTLYWLECHGAEC